MGSSENVLVWNKIEVVFHSNRKFSEKNISLHFKLESFEWTCTNNVTLEIDEPKFF